VLFEKGAKLELCPNSSLVVGNYVTFKTENNDPCLGLRKLGNNTQSVTFNNTTFINVPIDISNTEIVYNVCTFSRSDVIHHNEPLSVNYCSFEFSGLQAIQSVPDPDLLCWIRNTEVSNSTIAGIQVTGYSKLKIQDNNIHHNYSGIELYECTGGIISDNEISFNGNGIMLYHTNASIIGHNKMTYNYSSSGHGDNRGGYGIDARHFSSWSLIGQDAYPIQTIHDNQREQILMQSNSIFTHMYRNKVYSLNHSKPYISIWDPFFGTPGQINISNNNWSSDFVPSRDLSPEPAYTYLPIWEPGIPLQLLEDEAFQLLEEAMAAADNMDYIVAEQKLKQIIEEYPETMVCIEASKQLLILVEKYNQNYDALALYYTTYPTLRDDPTLAKIADYLANFCKMKSGDYPEAIQFFEDLILNPPSLPDSVFAVIDAGYAYLLMAQNSDKSSFVGELKWLKPASVSAYLSNRNALINNRLSDTTDNSHSTPGIPNAIRISNYPNPFNPNTTIDFYLPEPGDVTLEVFNIKGQRVKTLINEHKETGSHNIVWNGTDQNGRFVSSGVYFYRLSTGTNSLINRMLLMK
jgi:parallel beta-helix repeat protein